MKKILALLATFTLLAATSASATFVDTYWDLNAVDPTYFNVDDGITEAFFEITYYAETNSTISAGGFISDSGLANATQLNFTSGNVPGDNEGFGSLYGLTMVWDNLEGVVTFQDASVIEATYTSGTFNFYIDYDPYAINYNDPSSFTDGMLVATVEVTSGDYRLTLDGSAGSSYVINGDFTYILEGFWFEASTGKDLAELIAEMGVGWVYAYTAGDNDPASVDITFNDDGSITVFSTHDSSISVGIIPEPSTIMLLGAGLLGAGLYLRRKNRK
jgi:hypothetical protein